jgi:hypothetical protein
MKQNCKNCIDRKWKIKTGRCRECVNYVENEKDLYNLIEMSKREIIEWEKFILECKKRLKKL